MSTNDLSKTMIAMLQLQSTKARGEEVSEFTSARTHAEFFLRHFLDALNSGVPRSEVIFLLSFNSGCSRKTASKVLGKVLRKAKYDKPEINAGPATQQPTDDTPVAPIKKRRDKPIVDDTENSEPVTQVPETAEFSESAKYIEKPAEPVSIDKKKWKPDFVIGSGFHGYDDEKTEQEKERIQRARMLDDAHPLSETVEVFRRNQEKAAAAGEVIVTDKGNGIYNFVDDEGK